MRVARGLAFGESEEKKQIPRPVQKANEARKDMDYVRGEGRAVIQGPASERVVRTTGRLGLF
jgi:hypothetical protein